MRDLLIHADLLLRGRDAAEASVTPARLRHLLALMIAYGAAYGVAMGSFAGVGGGHWLQLIYSAAKVPLLLAATFLLSMPSFFVLNTVFGLRPDIVPVVRAVVSAQAGLTIVLASFAPFTLVWYASFADYDSAVLFNAAMFGAASLTGQWLLRRAYAPLIAANRRHRLLLWTWIVIYAFVGIQMGWILRPFVGDPRTPPQFFRAEMWGNAYEIVAAKVVKAVKAPDHAAHQPWERR
jgi:hypothetical protein